MITLEFHLYRIKFVRTKNPTLFAAGMPDALPGQIMHEAIFEKPRLAFREGHEWHVGNIEPISETSGYFAFGRRSEKKAGKYNEAQGNFVEEFDEDSPWTHIIFDCDIGFLGIAKKPKLAADVMTIARQLQKTLSKAYAVSAREITVHVDPIPDPQSFLDKIATCYAVKKFTAGFTGPNPYDADELFQKPLSAYCKEAHGLNGKVVLDGTALDPDVLSAVTRSSSASGNEVSANIQEAAGKRSIKITLDKDAIKRFYEVEEMDKNVIHADLKKTYQGVRKA